MGKVFFSPAPKKKHAPPPAILSAMARSSMPFSTRKVCPEGIPSSQIPNFTEFIRLYVADAIISERPPCRTSRPSISNDECRLSRCRDVSFAALRNIRTRRKNSSAVPILPVERIYYYFAGVMGLCASIESFGKVGLPFLTRNCLMFTPSKLLKITTLKQNF